MKKMVLLILIAMCHKNLAQNIDTVEVKDIDQSKPLTGFDHKLLMYVTFKGKSSLNALVEYKGVNMQNGLYSLSRVTKTATTENIDSVLVDAGTFETVYITLKNKRRDSLQLFDFGKKNKVLMGRSYDATYHKEMDIPKNTFCTLAISELLKKLNIKDNTTYVIRNYNPYANKTDYQSLTVKGKESLELIGGGKIEAWKLELTQGKFVYRMWLETKTSELIKQVSIFPNGAEYWESRIY